MKTDMRVENVFFVISESNLFLNPVAIRPVFRIEENAIKAVEWEDTSRGVGFNVLKTEPSEIQNLQNIKEIKLFTDKGQILLQELTLPLFKKTSELVAGGGTLLKTYNTDEDLRLYYLNTDFSGYSL